MFSFCALFVNGNAFRSIDDFFVACLTRRPWREKGPLERCGLFCFAVHTAIDVCQEQGLYF